MAAGVPPQGLPPLADPGRAGLGQGELPPSRLPEDRLLQRPQGQGPQVRLHGRGGPGAVAHLREAGCPHPRAGLPGRRGRGRGLRFRERDHHLQGEAGHGRHHLLQLQRGRAGASRAHQEIPRQRGASRRQLLRGPQQRRVHGRQLRVHPQGRHLPHGSQHLLPHQQQGLRPVRAHPHRRRGRRQRQLSGRLHRTAVRHQPAARGCGGAGGPGTPATRTAWAASSTS